MSVADIVCCTSCGVAEIDDVKLKRCDDGCDLVKYCSDECHKIHREQHEEECMKRKAELHDIKLFTQSEMSHHGECPICCLPLPLDPAKSALMTCCCKLICMGCNYTTKKREIDQGLEQRCAFCREPAPKSQEEGLKQIMKRIKKNDPVAMTEMAKKHLEEGDYGKAFEYLTQAAELGDATANGILGGSYRTGEGIEKDEKKAVYHLEQAAIGGHTSARSLLAKYEMMNCRFERAVKHQIIAANLGYEPSLKPIKYMFVAGIVSKEEYAAALRGFQAAVNETKSAEREKGEAFFERVRGL
jgi:hypothetical protein